MEYFICLESILKCECPNCKTINYYSINMIRNEPCYDADGLTCWNCKQSFFFDHVNAEMNDFDIENGMFDDGESKGNIF